MGNIINIIGMKFNKLKVVSRSSTKFKDIYYNCICECGNNCIIRGHSIRHGNTKSCGCLQKKISSNLLKKNRKNTNLKHGSYKKDEYCNWLNLKARCARDRNYVNKNITVCDEWKNSFEQFFKDMGPRPSKKHSIDRIDNNGPYSKENCRWATNYQQSRNRGTNRIITFNNETKLLCDWAKDLNIKQNTLSLRLKKWSIEKALTLKKMY
jgi:hypothetical protein